MYSIPSNKFLTLLVLIFIISSILMFVNIGFESLNRALNKEISTINNEKSKLKVSYLQHSSINNLSGTANRLEMVHINDKNSFIISDSAYEYSNKLNNKTISDRFNEYQKQRKTFLYGF